MQRIYKFFSKRINATYQEEFNRSLYRSNLEKNFLMCFVVLLFALLLLPLEWMRYREGTLFVQTDYKIFLGLHIGLLLLAIPLLLSQMMIAKLHAGEPFRRFPVISVTIVLLSFILLSIDYLTLWQRMTTATYPIFILFINSVIVMSHRNRWAFNLLSISLISFIIFDTCKGHEVLTYINILQSLAMTITAFVIGTHQLNSAIRQFTFEKLLTAQQQKSDELLLNILPESVVTELKENGNIQAQTFDNVTIMFCDFVDFSKICQQHPAEILVETLNFYFKKFDEIIGNYAIEKIKTIGDAYLCTSGVPTPNAQHAQQTVNAAIAIRDFVLAEAEKRKKSGALYFDIRIGIHSGKVVAGIVGTKKFAYDIWGDSVNVAARLQTAATVNSILLSKNTEDLLEQHHSNTFKAELDLKNVGKIKVYEVAN
jgi:class 3 adenylate cyclase